MPCGGIYPVKGSWVEKYSSNGICWFDDGNTSALQGDLFVEEWDTNLHKKCLYKFLQTDEGKIVIEHGHNIIQSV